MRCKACNEILSIYEIKKKSIDGQYEDLCFKCLGIVFNINKDIDDIEYAENFENDDD